MEICEISKNQKKLIQSVVNIHLNTFENFFLTFLGRGFLFHMYSSYCEHKDSTLLSALDETGAVIGFVAYSKNMSQLYKHMIKRRLIPFAWYSFWAFIRKPKIFMRLLRAFLKPSEVARTEKYVEISSIGVAVNEKAKGVGTMLLQEVKRRVDFSTISYIALETDAVNNDSVNYFYKKNGFELVREYETREGRKMNEYRFRK